MNIYLTLDLRRFWIYESKYKLQETYRKKIIQEMPYIFLKKNHIAGYFYNPNKPFYRDQLPFFRTLKIYDGPIDKERLIALKGIYDNKICAMVALQESNYISNEYVGCWFKVVQNKFCNSLFGYIGSAKIISNIIVYNATYAKLSISQSIIDMEYHESDQTFRLSDCTKTNPIFVLTGYHVVNIETDGDQITYDEVEFRDLFYLTLLCGIMSREEGIGIDLRLPSRQIMVCGETLRYDEIDQIDLYQINKNKLILYE